MNKLRGCWSPDQQLLMTICYIVKRIDQLFLRVFILLNKDKNVDFAKSGTRQPELNSSNAVWFKKNSSFIVVGRLTNYYKINIIINLSIQISFRELKSYSPYLRAAIYRVYLFAGLRLLLLFYILEEAFCNCLH